MGIIKSILDTDLYKLSMSYAYMKLYPEAEGVFEFCDRNKVKRTQHDVEQILNEIKKLEDLQLTSDEFNWCIKHIPYIPEFYWEWLCGFRFDASKVKVYLDGERILHIEATDKLYRLTFWEIACLAIVSEISNRMHVIQMADVLKRLDTKIALNVGRYTADKRQADLIRIWSKIPDKNGWPVLRLISAVFQRSPNGRYAEETWFLYICSTLFPV